MKDGPDSNTLRFRQLSFFPDHGIRMIDLPGEAKFENILNPSPKQLGHQHVHFATCNKG